MNTLFCIGTFQAIANLPPLLAVAQAGDQVIFLDSQAVSKKQSSARLIKLLPANLHAQSLAIPDALPEIIEKIRNFLSTIAQDQKIYLIFNGGTKMASLAILEALRPYQPKIIYGQEQPCEYWQCGSDLKTVENFYYQSQGITLEQLLGSNEVEIFDNTHKLLYRYQNFYAQLPKDFGYVLADTMKIYEAYYKGKGNTPEGFLNFDDLLRFKSEELVTWQNILIDLVRQPLKEKAIMEGIYQATLNFLDVPEESQETYLRSALSNPQLVTVFQNNILIFLSKNYPSPQPNLIPKHESLKGFYNKFLSVLQLKTIAANASPTKIPIGNIFENAVAARTIDFLKQNKSYQNIIAEIWLQVKVAHKNKPEITIAEYDVLILLKNAVLLHLECKSGGFEQKDLDARQYVMQSSTSKLAKIYIVSPLFTDLQKNPCFAAMQKNVETFQNQRDTNYLFLTLPNQPNTFTYIDQSGEQKTVTVPTFEDSLKRILQPYLSTQPTH